MTQLSTFPPYLSLAIWLPILFGVLVLAIGRDKNAGMVRILSLVGAVVSLLPTIPLITNFDNAAHGMQFFEQAAWIERFNIFYRLGVDGLSLWFVPLTAFITIIVVAAAWQVIEERVAQYMGSFLILSGLMIGVFVALDGLLFYFFFEATLIPMFIIIGVFGGPNRVYAAFKFFLYTFFGSLLTLVAIVYLYTQSQTFDILAWHQLPLTMKEQILIFIAFFMAFAVKVPMWPVHTWLPDAHVEAPTGGSVVLAAIMLKLGAYGFLRFSLPIAPDASQYLAPVVIVLSLIAVIYIGLVALVQKDMKKLVAYSSIAHMGFVTLGFFMFNDLGVQGGLMQSISHGFVSGAMFLCIGVLYDRVHSREIAAYGGVVNTMPKFAAFAVLFSMANAGLPATSGFIGEIHGHPGRRAVQLLDRPGCWHRPDPGRGLLAVDGQARHLRTGRQQARRRTDRPERPRVRHPVGAGDRHAADGPVPGADRRNAAGVGDRPPATRRSQQSASINCHE